MKLLLASGVAATLLAGAGTYALAAEEFGASDEADSERTSVPEVEIPEVEIPEVEAGEQDKARDEPSGEPSGEPASEIGAERKAAAGVFVSAMQTWTVCVGEAAEAHESGAFDPVAACGERPMPQRPAQAQGPASGAPEGVPAGPPAGVPGGRP